MHASTEPLLGAHLSIAGGFTRAIERARGLRCNVLQIFVKNSNRWQGKTLAEEEAEAFRTARCRARLNHAVAHDSYLINLAASEGDLRRRSIAGFVDEMQRGDQLGLSYLVTHPGSHGGDGEAVGITRVCEAIDEIHERLGDSAIRIAIEGTAGQGNGLGYRFEHLRDLISGCRRADRVFVCLDTCHLFAAGYDLRDDEAYDQTMASFSRLVGLDKLRVLHLNDSKRELGSRVDRHEHIGQGRLGLRPFELILNDPRLARIPKVLETPKGETPKEDRRNLRVLRGLIRR